MNRAATLAALAALSTCLSTNAAQPVVIDFEGVVPSQGQGPFGDRALGAFYREERGLDVTFSGEAWASRSRSQGNGQGNFVNTPSGVAAMYLVGNPTEAVTATMTVAEGFSGSVSFAYASRSGGSVSFRDAQGLCLLCDQTLSEIDQGEGGGGLRVWRTVRFEFSGVARTAEFSGRGNSIVFDNIVLSPVPEPSTLAMGGFGVLALAAWSRRRRTHRT